MSGPGSERIVRAVANAIAAELDAMDSPVPLNESGIAWLRMLADTGALLFIGVRLGDETPIDRPISLRLVEDPT